LFGRAAALVGRFQASDQDDNPDHTETSWRLRIKAAERVLAEAWISWHGDDRLIAGLEAASRQLKRYLGWQDPEAAREVARAEEVMVYVRYLLRALLDPDEADDQSFPLDVSFQIPPWPADLALGHDLASYELVRAARGQLTRTPRQAVQRFEQLATTLDTPAWLLPQACELWARAAEQANAELAVQTALRRWRGLWPGARDFPDPVAEARAEEGAGFHRRAQQLRSNLVSLSQLEYVRQGREAALRLLEPFTDEERRRFSTPYPQWPTLQEMQQYFALHQPCSDVIVHEVPEPDLAAAQQWAEGDAYTRWYGCRKAVLVESTIESREVEIDSARQAKTDADLLQELASNLTAALKPLLVPEVRSTKLAVQTPPDPIPWVWCFPLEQLCQGVALAVWLERSRVDRSFLNVRRCVSVMLDHERFDVDAVKLAMRQVRDFKTGKGDVSRLAARLDRQIVEWQDHLQRDLSAATQGSYRRG
jgi:hypothetical protein